MPPCSCGRKLPLIEFIGRRGEEIILPSGKKIRILFLQNSIMKSELGRKMRQFQLKQEALDRFRLFIVPRESFSEDEEIRLRLDITALFGGENIFLDIKYVEAIPATSGGKPRLFIPLG